MKEKQNIQLIHSPDKPFKNALVPLIELHSNQTHLKISSPKFNRKTSFNFRNTKGSPLTFQNQNCIQFVSPKKLGIQLDYFSKIAQYQLHSERHKTNQLCQNIEKYKTSQSYDRQQLLSQKQGEKRCHLKDQVLQTDDKARQKESLFCLVLQLKEQNKKLMEKIKEFVSMREFLIQRQGYIYKLSQVNSKNLEEIAYLTQKISIQALNIQNLENNVSEQKQCLQKQNQRLHQLCQKQQHQLMVRQKEIERLQAEIKCLKAQKDSKEVIIQNTFQNKTENSQNLSSNESLLIQSGFTDITSSLISDNSEIADQSTFPQKKLTQSKASDQYLLLKALDQPSKLRQKLRYSQIKIDVLSKIKDQSLKVKEENQKLKGLNRRFLSRIQYFTKRYSRRADSDSSLQLSLTPKKKSDFD